MKKIRNKNWKRRDVILLLERLELCISAGVTISSALEAALQGISKGHSGSLRQVYAMVQSGGSLSRALSQFTGMSATSVSLIQHGQKSGLLAKALGDARILLERQDELLKRCISALVYPLTIALFAGIITIGLMRGIMPQIIPLLKSLNVPLPFLTRLVMAVSEGLLSYGLVFVIGVLLIVFGAYWAYKKYQHFRYLYQRLLKAIPIIGRIIQDYSLAVFLRSAGTLVESGMSVILAYKNAVLVLPFLPLRNILEKGVIDITGGGSLSRVFSDKTIPGYITPIVSAGEASGTLGLCLIRAADILGRDIDHGLKRSTALLEPLMMAAMGCIVAAIAISIMLPIYDISRVLKH
ncbi:MAG: hypothetical protein A3B11_01395 [Candidatus Taylorbacteria bacterium RIFCSPLOWO2_01_FULL_44_26]|uniref:Type II secretion system protein GspF domain-containing protein n=2 Tax=Candidatus Tayloriibacteriota TaxID=1817919 RepID=A0A1G2MK79_9BACT|nr:MAG: hypothetical protein A3D50_01175 [Candidatus Taylorbacteria bacterium RIFCSPHIGHO2_02_FULL_44_12]OHA30969.1 MAG: hypothetical protein A3B11_01395 [Candidatus Taylorbacteria bacterium RIFCSPLOWO2_01_FULL_44_26]